MAEQTVEELIVRIEADFNQLRKQMGAAEGVMTSSGKKMGRSMDTVRLAVDKVGTRIVAMGAAIGGVVAGFVAMQRVVDGFSSGTELATLAARLDITAQSLSELSFVSSQFGIEQEELADIMKDLTEKIGDAASGGATYEEAFKRMGLVTKDLMDLNAEQQFLAVVDALGKMENQSSKTFTAMEIMSEGGFRVVEMAELSAKQIAEMRIEAQRLGVALSDVDANKIREATVAFRNVDKVIQGVVNRLVVELSPAIKDMSDKIIQMSKDADDAGQTFASWGDSFRSSVALAIDAVNGLMLVWDAMAMLFSNVANTILIIFSKLAKAVLTFGEIASRAFAVTEATGAMAMRSLEFLWIAGWASIEQVVTRVLSAVSSKMLSLGESIAVVNTSFGNAIISAAKSLDAAAVNTAESTQARIDTAKTAALDSATALSEAVTAMDAPITFEDSSWHQFFDDLETTAADTMERVGEAFRNSIVNATGGEDATGLTSGQSFAGSEEGPSAFELINGVTEDEAMDAMSNMAELRESFNQERKAMERKAGDTSKKQTKDLASALLGIEDQRFGAALSGASGFFGDMATIFASGGKKNFEIVKQMQSAGAIVDSLKAANGAYASLSWIPAVGPALGAAAAAAALGAGFANVRAIQAQSFGGGAGGAPAIPAPPSLSGVDLANAGGGAGAGAGAPANPNIFNVNITGDNHSGESVRDLIRAINDQTDDNMTLNVRSTIS